jgi:hypothetical protein
MVCFSSPVAKPLATKLTRTEPRELKLSSLVANYWSGKKEMCWKDGVASKTSK